jgi:hypothetical protein
VIQRGSNVCSQHRPCLHGVMRAADIASVVGQPRSGAYTRPLSNVNVTTFCMRYWLVPITNTAQVELRSGRVEALAHSFHSSACRKHFRWGDNAWFQWANTAQVGLRSGRVYTPADVRWSTRRLRCGCIEFGSDTFGADDILRLAPARGCGGARPNFPPTEM